MFDAVAQSPFVGRPFLPPEAPLSALNAPGRLSAQLRLPAPLGADDRLAHNLS